MRLLLDLGNSRLKWAAASASTQAWSLHGSVAWSDETDPALERAWSSLAQPQDVICASVVDSAREAQLTAAVHKRFGRAPRWLRTPAVGAGVRNGYAQAEQLGVDRFLSMVAARADGAGPYVVVSAGTALTLDAVSGDGQHLGGWIVPGAHAMRQTLSGATSRVTADEGDVVDQACNTADGVSSGVWHALAAVVGRFAARAALRFGTTPVVLIGGGDAERLLPMLDIPARLMGDSVLRGLARWVALEGVPGSSEHRGNISTEAGQA